MEDFLPLNIIVWPENGSTEKNIIGRNQKGIFVVLVSEKETHEADELEFLEKVFTALQLNLLEDASIISLSHKSVVSLFELGKSVNFDHVLVFGGNPAFLGMNTDIAPYSETKLLGVSYLYVDSISALQTDIEKKRRLWAVLQRIFAQKA